MAPRVPISKSKEPDAKLCWSSGADYAFDKESILAHVPQDSGVYAVDHFGIELFIGESANIREALLRHYYRHDFQTDQGRPTGFTFEVCAAEIRAKNAKSLIARFQPVHQTEFVPKESWGFISDRGVEQVQSFNAPLESRLEVPAVTAPGETQPSVRKRFYFEPRQVVVLAATFLLSLAVVFYLGILTGESFQKKTNSTVEKPEVKGTAAATMERFASTAGASASDSILPAKQNLQPVESGLTGIDERQVATATKNTEMKRPAPAKAKSAASPPPPPAQVVAAKAPAVDKEVARAEDTAVVERETTWSVQLGAGTAKQMIKDQIARLKTKGYQGYVVETERDGQTWYRIRVGRFGTRAEAETLRQALENQEGFKSPVTIGE